MSTEESPNGHVPSNGTSEPDDVELLRKELEATKEERDSLQTQYSGLLTKVTNLRNTLGKKLQEDAEELDRRESEINSLQDEISSLQSTLSTLQSELESSAAECTNLTETLNTTTSTLTTAQSELRTTEYDLKRCQSELRNVESQLTDRENDFERLRLERESTGHSAATLTLELDELKASFTSVQSELETLRDQLRRTEEEREKQREEKENLKDVLADFQDMKDHELKLAVKDLDSQLSQVTQSLAEWKSRALNAELTLDESKSSSARVTELESQVKEKEALVKKFRHEAVILNSHLTEALRRLRQNTTNSTMTVDRRLVSNIVLQFLNIPRGDTKRFEVLTLLGTILDWNDSERERAGLSRSHQSPPASLAPIQKSSFWSRGSASTTDLTSTASSSATGKGDGLDEPSESFSNLWVEFLLTESGATTDSSTATNSTSPPISPLRHSLGSNPGSPPPKSLPTRRLGSFSADQLKEGS